ncbi:MAG: hypothetical protein HY925_08310 [Elusimicrobia bacterium]|nr:hypothetical protein [Elusimicrobiota bacterium]
MQPSHRHAAIAAALLILAAGATIFGIKVPRTTVDESAGIPVADPPAAAPAVPETAKPAGSAGAGHSGLEMVSGGLPTAGGPTSNPAFAADPRTAPLPSAASLSAQLAAALGMQAAEGLGEPAADPAAATPGERFVAEDAKADSGLGGGERGAAPSAPSGPGLSAGGAAGPNPGSPVTLPPPAPTPAGILLSMFKPAERGKLLQQLETGKGLVDSCKTSGLAAQCMAAGQTCVRYESCQRWLAGQLAGTARAKAGEAAAGGTQVSGRGAADPSQVLETGAEAPVRAAASGSKGGARATLAAAKPSEPAAAPTPKPAVGSPTPTPTPTPSPRPSPSPTPTLRLPSAKDTVLRKNQLQLE